MAEQPTLEEAVSLLRGTLQHTTWCDTAMMGDDWACDCGKNDRLQFLRQYDAWRWKQPVHESGGKTGGAAPSPNYMMDGPAWQPGTKPGDPS